VILYVHDDLTDDVHDRHGAGSPAGALAAEILSLVRRDTVRVITLGPQVEALAAQGPHAPFALTLGIGPAGERVARQVHARTGWFPAIRQVDLTREEDGRGGLAVVSLRGTSLAEQLAGVETAASLALVDDTLFSGLTLRTLLAALPPAIRTRARAFCLRGIAESIPSVDCPLSVGFAAPGQIEVDVSFINASGLVRRGAIRRAGAAPLAFFERPEWIRDWFGAAADVLIDRCARLNALLEPDGQPSLPRPV
jgi:hypothetical protein